MFREHPDEPHGCLPASAIALSSAETTVEQCTPALTKHNWRESRPNELAAVYINVVRDYGVFLGAVLDSPEQLARGSAADSAPQPLKPMRPISLPNTVDYVETPSRDLPKTKAFFTSLLGWQFTEYGPEYLDYSDGRTTGGFYRSDKVSSYSAGSTIAVIYTEHLEELRDRAVKLGATITRDIFPFPGGRRFHFTEPGGSEFAIWSDK